MFIEDIKISPIFYMGNKKKLIAKGLVNYFPDNIHTFVDLFAGSAVVSMNVQAKKYIVNDLNEHLYSFYNMFSTISSGDIIKKIESNIKRFSLNKTGVKQNTTEAEIFKPRYVAMRRYANKTKNILDLYSCMFYAFSQQMRFNNKGDFNMPFGNGAFTDKNKTYIKNGCNFFSNQTVKISNKDFRKLRIQSLNSNDFIYIDPPYFNTTATYNENGGWTLKDEYDLYDFCERLDDSGIRFALSNVFTNKGMTNSHLIDWVGKQGYDVHFFDEFTYAACGKGNAKTAEVLITNY